MLIVPAIAGISVNTGNTKTAQNNIAMVNKIIEHATAKVKNPNNAYIQALFVPVEKAAQNWIEAINNSDADAAKLLFGSFMPDFK